MNEFHFNILSASQQNIFDRLASNSSIQKFYLAGGTALALLIGHRRSEDLDLFYPESFENVKILKLIQEIGKFELFSEAKNTIHGAIEGVRISFISFQYPLIQPYMQYINLNIASLLDIALMKLNAVSGRGDRKDFIDIFYLLNHFTLDELLKRYTVKFGTDISNHYHLLKSLVYFTDAEQQPMPVMIEQISWQEMKKSLVSTVQKYNNHISNGI
jgi:hypothetical protein